MLKELRFEAVFPQKKKIILLNLVALLCFGALNGGE